MVIPTASVGPGLAAAQPASVSIRVSGRWKVGDEVRYERTRTRVDSRADKPTRTPVTLKVREVADASHVVSWRLRPIRLTHERKIRVGDRGRNDRIAYIGQA